MAQRFENWRILPELHKEIAIRSKEEDVPMYELARQAWDAYLGRLEPKSSKPYSDPALTPRDQRERELVAGLLLLFRDKREIAQGVKEIVAGLLSNWINKAKAAISDLNGGERSA